MTRSYMTLAIVNYECDLDNRHGPKAVLTQTRWLSNNLKSTCRTYIITYITTVSQCKRLDGNGSRVQWRIPIRKTKDRHICRTTNMCSDTDAHVMFFTSHHNKVHMHTIQSNTHQCNKQSFIINNNNNKRIQCKRIKYILLLWCGKYTKIISH